MSLSPSTSVAFLSADLTPNGSLVGGAAPRLSWKMQTDVADWAQQSAELEIQRSGGAQLITLESSESSLVEWPFGPITPREQVIVRVRVTGVDGATTPWSRSLELVGGFLAAGEWRAQMIGAADAARLRDPPALRPER